MGDRINGNKILHSSAIYTFKICTLPDCYVKVFHDQKCQMFFTPITITYQFNPP